MSDKKEMKHKRKERAKRNLETLSQVRLTDYIPWGGILRGVLTIVILILLYLNWNPLVSYLASTLKYSVGLVQNQSEATVVANYLLVALTIATIAVEFIPFLFSWLNRPRISLKSISHFGNGYLRIKLGNEPERKLRLWMVYLEIWNSGRSPAFDPLVFVGMSNDKLSYLARSLGARTDAVTLEKQILALMANIYDTVEFDDLAIAFIQKGMKKIEYIPGRQDGKRFVLGFSFEGSKYFYLASIDSALLPKIELGDEKVQFVSVNFHARNSPKKILRVNIPSYFTSWDKVKFDYRAQEPLALLENQGQL
jgi:hypothetical protein